MNILLYRNILLQPSHLHSRTSSSYTRSPTVGPVNGQLDIVFLRRHSILWKQSTHQRKINGEELMQFFLLIINWYVMNGAFKYSIFPDRRIIDSK